MPFEIANKLKQVQNESKLKVYEDAFEKIRKSTNIKDPTKLYQKFMNRDNVYESLVSQKEMLGKQLVDLRKLQDETAVELDSVQYGNDVISSMYMRQVDDAMVSAEGRKNENAKKLQYMRHLLKEIRTGSAHLAALCGVSSVEAEKDAFLHVSSHG